MAGGWGYERVGNTGNKGVQLHALKMCNADGVVGSADATAAIGDAADPEVYGAHIINASWGGLYAYSETMRAAVCYAARMGVVFVAAKGNNNVPVMHFPSDYDNEWVISVGATNLSGGRAEHPDWGWGTGSGSNYSYGIDVVAPGTMILSTTPTYETSKMEEYSLSTYYDTLSGTSMAAPHVAGLAALLLAEDPTLHPEDVQGLIRSGAEDKGDPGYDDEYGAGRINAHTSLSYLAAPWTLSHRTATGGTVESVTPKYTWTFFNTGGGLETGEYTVQKYDVRRTVDIVEV